jgi:hypothetical protein
VAVSLIRGRLGLRKVLSSVSLLLLLSLLSLLSLLWLVSVVVDDALEKMDQPLLLMRLAIAIKVFSFFAGSRCCFSSLVGSLIKF